MSTESAWVRRDRGADVDKACDSCGRVLYAATKSTELLCRGCGEPASACPCPETREYA